MGFDMVGRCSDGLKEKIQRQDAVARESQTVSPFLTFNQRRDTTGHEHTRGDDGYVVVSDGVEERRRDTVEQEKGRGSQT